MDAHAHWDGQRLLRLARCLQPSRSGAEGDEEGVALGVDLDALMALTRFSHHATMLGKRV